MAMRFAAARALLAAACLLGGFLPPALAARVTISFDEVAASDQPRASTYMIERGAVMDTAHSMVRDYSAAAWVRLTSAPNALLLWSNSVIVFPRPVSNVSFVRLGSDMAARRDAWIATAYDVNGAPLLTSSEPVMAVGPAVPNQTFVFNTGGIKALAFNVASDLRDPSGELVDSTQLHIDSLAFDAPPAPSCSGFSNATIFAFAAQTYPFLFAGTPYAGQLGPYEWRYYPGSNMFLAVEDGSCAVWIQGPSTGGVAVRVTAVATIAANVNAWIAAAGNNGGGNNNGGGTNPPPCTYTVSPTTVTIPAGADAASIGVSVQVRQNESTCVVPTQPWTVQSNSAWLVVTVGALSNGQGPAYIRADPNTTTQARQGSVTVAGIRVTVNQPAGANPIAGTYSGTWRGTCPVYNNAPVSGTWTMNVDAAGAISGSFDGSDRGVINGSVDASGALSSATGSAGVSSWAGSLGVPRGGTWRTGDCSGTWS